MASTPKPNLQVNTQLALIDTMLVDCVLSEEHTFESEVTEYPTESGADITDNVLPKPIVVTMNCVVSNTPLPPISSIRGPRNDGTPFSLLAATRAIGQVTPAQEAYKRLIQIRDAREPVTIRTSLDTFKNMVLKNLTIPRSKENGGALFFTATWQQIEIVTNTRGTRVAIPGAKDGGNRNKPTAPSQLKPIITDPYTGDWYDPDINGWREGAQLNPKTGLWEYRKGRPLHVDPHVWQTEDHLTDAEYRDQNQLGLVPVDKKTAVPGQNIGQQFTFTTNPKMIDIATGSRGALP